ncbi:MAG: tRNA (N6-threonylcarbamoyladenosine(37)-N6)-methyltransferase TrmO [Oligoflexia bacterium]|nr:tRNA (N6-threonylcarbamoyladenosine(37)-N6)-methyltransferase TrmO [Oligoflexia bacterium]
MSSEQFQFEAIGHVESCFKEKFGIPRQPGLVPEAKGIIQLKNDPNLRTAIRDLEGFSHLWLIFVFHKHGSRNWKPSIRPPRLGGARKVGVLSSRSPHRPNPIGLSAVGLEKIVLDAPQGPQLHVSGIDLLDGTPILDIKPYLPFADSLPQATAGWAHEEIRRVPVEFTPEALALVSEIESRGGYPNLRQLITEMLSLDPRPAFQQRQLPHNSPLAQNTEHGFRLFEYDVHWKIHDEKFLVLRVVDFIEFTVKTSPVTP